MRSSLPKTLLAKGADITAIDNEGKNVLHHLLTCTTKESTWTRTSDTKAFEHILSLPVGKRLVLQKDNSGFSTLHHALRSEQFWAIGPLLINGADPLEPNVEGNTALHFLASRISSPGADEHWRREPSAATPLFDRFLALGADINTINNAGESPIFNLITGKGFCKHHLQMFEEKGADLKLRNKEGQGLLHMIAAKKNIQAKSDKGQEMMEVKFFRYLMRKGLDAMAEDNESRSALDVALASGSVGILEIFRRE